MQITEELRAAYRATLFNVRAPRGGFDLRIGKKSIGMWCLYKDLGLPPDSSAYWITAHNPFSNIITPHMCRVRNTIMFNAITNSGDPNFINNREGQCVVNATGRAPSGDFPDEEGFLIINGKIDMLMLAIQYDQNAIVHIPPTLVPELVEVDHVNRRLRLSTSIQA